MVDLLRILVVLHTLGHVEKLDRGTVSNYLTGAKHHYTITRALFATVSPIWGPQGTLHPMITMMLKSIPHRHRPAKLLLTPGWIHEGFTHCWTTQEFVAIALMFGWMLRSGEVCDVSWTEHLITWSMVTFSLHDHSDSDTDDHWHLMPMHLLRTTPCDMVDLNQASRKYQQEFRPTPGRINVCHIADPSLGATTWNHLCMATILQGWAILNDVDHMTSSELATRPLLAAPHTITLITREQVGAAMRTLARRRNENEATVVPHCLRKAGINTLANSAFVTHEDAYLRTVGHKSIAASSAYITPTPATSALVTAAMHTSTPDLPPLPTNTA